MLRENNYHATSSETFRNGFFVYFNIYLNSFSMFLQVFLMVCKEDIITVAALMHPSEYYAFHICNINGLASVTASVVISAVPVSQLV
jgi:hypothetical protein